MMFSVGARFSRAGRSEHARSFVAPLGRGAYRVTVLDDGTAEITTRFGEADIYSAARRRESSSGRTMMVRERPPIRI